MRKLILIAALLASLPAFPQRNRVLQQIDLPHHYYYREMYLPQLTSGPSSVAWAPDSRSVVYSMQGSLWRQSRDSGVAQQLTAGPGYDYQPDWSRDGRRIVYARYHSDAVNLFLLDLQTGQSRQLTHGSDVNLEPRWSPDGTRIAFVSTSYNRRFHIFVMGLKEGQPATLERLTGETRSPLPRYYYSPFDTEISPTWSPDGSELIFVANRGHIYGTGGFWRMKAQPGAEAREIHYEETTWKARPDWSPEGKRLLYSSYLGQQWHQLWVIPAQGGDAFPLSYGQFDNTAPRWSPDGKYLAFISNRGGNTSLWIQDVLGGAQRQLEVRERRFLRPMGRLEVAVLDASGQTVPARIAVTGSDGRAYAPDDVWIHADDGFDRSRQAFEAHYFHCPGRCLLSVPAGTAQVQVTKGLEYRLENATANVTPEQPASLSISLHPLALPAQAGRWVSADLHVHMNYAGTYRNTPQKLVQQAEAENLAIVEDLVVNKEQRIPDIAYFSTRPDPASASGNLLLHSQEFHTSYWGHLGLLNLTRNFLLPDYAGYPNTAAASLFPANANVADMAHAQQALVGYVHPFGDPGVLSVPDPAAPAALTDELPADVALGKVDYIEVLGFSDHKSTASVWYRLLNCGFHLPAGAGTDAMANYASLHGPVGLTRVYAQVPEGELNIGTWLDSLRRGRTFASNGPHLGFTLGDQPIGGELRLPAGRHEIKFSAWLRSFVPVDHLQVICDGQAARDLPLTGRRDTANVEGTVPVARSGWCLLRAWNEKSDPAVLDAYPYATTSPIYITVGDSPTRSPEDAAYFVAWIDRLIQGASAHTGWNTEAEKAAVLKMLSDARAIYAAQTK